MKKTKDAHEFPTIDIEPSATSETVILQTLVTLDNNKADAALALLKKEFGGLIVDCSTPAGLKDAMSSRSKLIKLRTKGDAKRLEMNREDMKPINERNAVWKKIEPVLLQLEAPIDRSIKAQQEIDKENARIAAEQEQARVDAIRQRIEKIKNLLNSSVSLTAAALEQRIATVEAATVTVELYGEFAGEASTIKAEITAGMKEMLVTKKEQEAEAERVNLRARIATIRDWPRLVFGKSSADIEAALAGYLETEFPPFGELQEEADAARDESILQVMTIMQETKQREDDAAELEKLRAAQPKPEPQTSAPARSFAPLTSSRATVEPAPAAETVKEQEQLEPEPVPAAEQSKPDPRETETVTITRKEYEDLLADAKLLNHLRAAGVDNWEGWDIAIETMEADGD